MKSCTGFEGCGGERLGLQGGFGEEGGKGAAENFQNLKKMIYCLLCHFCDDDVASDYANDDLLIPELYGQKPDKGSAHKQKGG